MIYAALDPGVKNLGIVVCHIKERKVEVLHRNTLDVSNEQQSLIEFHTTVTDAIATVLKAYPISLIVFEKQMKANNRKILIHNLMNTNVQAIITAVSICSGCKFVGIEPREWHYFHGIKDKKTLKVYKSLNLKFDLLNRPILKTVHEFDALFMLTAHLFQ